MHLVARAVDFGVQTLGGIPVLLLSGSVEGCAVLGLLRAFSTGLGIKHPGQRLAREEASVC